MPPPLIDIGALKNPECLLEVNVFRYVVAINRVKDELFRLPCLFFLLVLRTQLGRLH